MTNEQLLTQILQILVEKKAKPAQSQSTTEIPVGVSNRHIHLSQEDLNHLFGQHYALTFFKALKQPGQFAAKETVCLAGPKGVIEHVRILGPVRPHSQIELSKSDCFKVGIQAPIRESGDLTDAATLTVIGPKGAKTLPQAAIIAKRHIHMTPEDARTYQVTDRETIAIQTQGERAGCLQEVVIRVSPDFALECHLDMDEANALGVGNGETVTLIKK